MRTILIGLAMACIALPAWAQTHDQNVARCGGNDHDLSISACTALIQSGQDPTYEIGAFFDLRGFDYEAKGLHDQAIADYTRAIALDPTDAPAYSMRGVAYEAKGLHDQAIADYTRAIALSPNDPYAHNYRGVAYEAKGLHDQAIADYRAALKITPDMKEPKDGLTRLGATP
jgi:tetratricopeptide (TPR) repeat protein